MSGRRPARGCAVSLGLLVALVLGLGGARGFAVTDASAQPPASRGGEARGRGMRTLILVRHGIYDDSDPRDEELGKALTPEGREQARLTGARLAAWPSRVSALHASTMTRARETAEIMTGALPGLRPQPDRDLRECTPPTDREDIMGDLAPGEADSCRTRLDHAFARYFRPSPERDTTEALVCHGNVIRYFVCRVLGLDPMRWLSMTIGNCSLTVVQVRPDGTMRLVLFGDVGHLPPRLQTYPRSAPADAMRRR